MTDDFELLFPHTCTVSNGGPYDDESFNAGVYFGEIAAALALAPLGVVVERYVPSPIVHTLDLLAANSDLLLAAEDADDIEGWSFVRIFPPDGDSAVRHWSV